VSGGNAQRIPPLSSRVRSSLGWFGAAAQPVQADLAPGRGADPSPPLTALASSSHRRAAGSHGEASGGAAADSIRFLECCLSPERSGLSDCRQIDCPTDVCYSKIRVLQRSIRVPAKIAVATDYETALGSAILANPENEVGRTTSRFLKRDLQQPALRP
jgi:hypothetical protein